ncbi:hypothetical protein L2E82_31491 [Cichorium intybus]|uniref:Uncharacterized protein n=1 Tax=Cichorium intybus TaxID=13427 RepID=A0ACB9BF00_CICIN|nr:hypothetical protein L2E82_31491 [Cichorium intybus]
MDQDFSNFIQVHNHNTIFLQWKQTSFGFDLNLAEEILGQGPTSCTCDILMMEVNMEPAKMNEKELNREEKVDLMYEELMMIRETNRRFERKFTVLKWFSLAAAAVVVARWLFS